MLVLVDTCIWSLAFRRTGHIDQHSEELKNLISEHRVQIIGPIRQEILSGIKDKKNFNLLRKMLTAFSDLALSTLDYECAAEFSNIIRSKGIQGSSVDFLICSAAYRYNLAIYTTDKDFERFQRHLPIKTL